MMILRQMKNQIEKEKKGFFSYSSNLITYQIRLKLVDSEKSLGQLEK
jgi:hypothetical protein